MNSDPLYVKIKDEVKPGDPPMSAFDAIDRFGYSASHTRAVINWMATKKLRHHWQWSRAPLRSNGFAFDAHRT